VVPPQPVPRIGDVLYGGIDRMRWNEVNLAFHAGSLPRDLREARGRLLRDQDIWLCRNLTEARRLLDFSNASGAENELIAVDSDLLAGRGTAEVGDAEVRWLGADVFQHGFGSQILGGVFRRPDVFREFVPLLNEQGLFELGSEAIGAYRSAYLARAREAGLEPLGSDPSRHFDTVYVGRPRGPRS